MVSVTGSNSLLRLDLSLNQNAFDLALNQRNYIGTKIFRPRGVGAQAANAGKVPLKSWLVQRDTRSSNRPGANRDDFTIEAWNYATDPYRWEVPIYDRELAIYRDVFDMETTARERVVGIIADHFERQAAEALYGGSHTTAATAKLTSGSADFRKDVFKAKCAVRSRFGKWPNALVMNSIQLYHLSVCAQVVDSVKYTVTPTQQQLQDLLAAFLDVKYLFVAGGLTNEANPGQTDPSITDIWDTTKCAVTCVAESDDFREPCLGRTLMWNGYGPGPGSGETISVLMDQYRSEEQEATVFRGKSDRVIKELFTEATQIITGVLDDTADGFAA